MTWLLVTYLLSAPCHPDGPLPWHLRDGVDITESYCSHREILCVASERFRTEEACRDEARRRWGESGWRTASRCTRTR